jgi:hypothetical protein
MDMMMLLLLLLLLHGPLLVGRVLQRKPGKASIQPSGRRLVV